VDGELGCLSGLQLSKWVSVAQASLTRLKLFVSWLVKVGRRTSSFTSLLIDFAVVAERERGAIAKASVSVCDFRPSRDYSNFLCCLHHYDWRTLVQKLAISKDSLKLTN